LKLKAKVNKQNLMSDCKWNLMSIPATSIVTLTASLNHYDYQWMWYC